MRSLLLVFAVLVACDVGTPAVSETFGCVVPSGATTHPARPLAGGTLLVSTVADIAFVSHPDTDSLDVVDLEAGAVAWRVQLPAGSEPGRIAEDEDGNAYVALRSSSAIAIVDPRARVVRTRAACQSPRGIAVDRSAIWVACATGELVLLSRVGDFHVSYELGGDLRDVVLSNGYVWVTRFRSAELLRVGQNGLVSVQRPEKQAKWSSSDAFEPHVAWRALAGGSGNIYVLHQLESGRVIDTNPAPTSAPPYGSSRDCFSGPVVSAITRFRLNQRPETIVVPSIAPAVDFTVLSPNELVIAAGGGFGPSAVRLLFNGSGCAASPLAVSLTNPVVGIAAMTNNQRVLVQTRDPSRLLAVGLEAFKTQPSLLAAARSVDLFPDPSDPGWTIFHTRTRAGIACASCHPEGGDDGHTWHFSTQVNQWNDDLRRTPSLRAGILATAPFHWDGSLADMTALAADTFTKRMGGRSLQSDEVDALASWVDSIPDVPARCSLDRAAIERGRALFYERGCGSCHSGPRFTNNQSFDVGTGGTFQVPSLVGVRSRAPYMHTGCAPTLAARLTDEGCGGGNAHGRTSGLTKAQRADLEGFLESL